MTFPCEVDCDVAVQPCLSSMCPDGKIHARRARRSVAGSTAQSSTLPKQVGHERQETAVEELAALT